MPCPPLVGPLIMSPSDVLPENWVTPFRVSPAFVRGCRVCAHPGRERAFFVRVRPKGVVKPGNGAKR